MSANFDPFLEIQIRAAYDEAAENPVVEGTDRVFKAHSLRVAPDDSPYSVVPQHAELNEVLVPADDPDAFREIHRIITQVIFRDHVSEPPEYYEEAAECELELRMQEVSAMNVFEPKDVMIGTGAVYIQKRDDRKRERLMPSFYPLTVGSYETTKLGYASVLAAAFLVPTISKNRLLGIGYASVPEVGRTIDTHNEGGGQPKLYVPQSCRPDDGPTASKG